MTSSVDLSTLLTVEDFRRAAKERLATMAYDYYRSGADRGRTLRANRRAFRDYEIWHRVLVDVETLDTSATVVGTDVSCPILIAPTAYHRMAHADGEIGTARAAEARGTVYVLSTLSTTSLEDVARTSMGPKWFQLYVHRDRGLTQALVARAEAAGYRAIALTVDAPLLGRRLADVRNSFALPDGLAMANFTAAASEVPRHEQASALARYVASRHDPTLHWRDIEWLRGITRLPIVIKGLVRDDDAVRAVEAGVDGIVVSNHGGRQLDCGPATLHALPAVVQAVAGRCDVLMDGGIRAGTDVLMALALGAKAVLVGRPVLWGLAVAGAPGVERVLAILEEELSMAMALAGCASVRDIDPSLVRRRGRAKSH